MNRLHHLKKTLPQNIKDNIGYGNIEFIVLNYNSKDSLDEWIKNEMNVFLELGILNYFKTKEPQNFHMSHSKNIAARCASGDIICNVDADNFTGFGFADFINNKFQKNEKIFISTDKMFSTPDCYGRICVKKVDFNRCKGYDENMINYGFEDFDLKNRLKFLKLEEVVVKKKKYLKAIRHSDYERIKGAKSFSEIKTIYTYPVNHVSFILLVLFKSFKYSIGKVIKNRYKNSESIDNLFIENRVFEYEYFILNDKWIEGFWIENDKGRMLAEISFDIRVGNTLGQNIAKSNKNLLIKEFNFQKILSNEEILHLMMFFFQISNRNKMKQNLKKKLVVVNRSFGCAKLIKNFREKIELS